MAITVKCKCGRGEMTFPNLNPGDIEHYECENCADGQELPKEPEMKKDESPEPQMPEQPKEEPPKKEKKRRSNKKEDSEPKAE